MRITAEQVAALYAMRRAGRYFDMVTTGDGRLVVEAQDPRGEARRWIISPQGKSDALEPPAKTLAEVMATLEDPVCPSCNGEGYVRTEGPERMAMEHRCDRCDGLGLL